MKAFFIGHHFLVNADLAKLIDQYCPRLALGLICQKPVNGCGFTNTKKPSDDVGRNGVGLLVHKISSFINGTGGDGYDE
jgi:hypothetical protein